MNSVGHVQPGPQPVQPDTGTVLTTVIQLKLRSYTTKFYVANIKKTSIERDHLGDWSAKAIFRVLTLKMASARLIMIG